MQAHCRALVQLAHKLSSKEVMRQNRFPLSYMDSLESYKPHRLSGMASRDAACRMTQTRGGEEMKRIVLLSVALVLVFAIAACAPASTPVPTAPPPTTAPVVTPLPPTQAPTAVPPTAAPKPTTAPTTAAA